MSYSRRYTTWHNWPTTDTPVDAAFLQGVEDWINSVANGGTGDNITNYVATVGQAFDVRVATSSAPDTSTNPALKVSRTEEAANGSLTGDGGEQLAAILGSAKGTVSTQGQPVGVYGVSQSASTQSAYNDDACGLYGVGRITGSGTGTGIGGFVNGRRDTNTGRACGLEVSCDNETATAGVYSSTVFSDTTGAWVHATGTADSAVAIAFGNPFSAKFDVGIAFINQNGGPVTSASIRDDGNATTSIDVNGTHTHGIDFFDATLSGHAVRVGPSSIQFKERGSDPAAPNTDLAVLYARDNGSSKTQLCVRFPTGAVQVIATEP